MVVHRTEKKDVGLIRNIVYFLNNGHIVNETLLLQYYFGKAVPADTEELIFDVAAHGNSKSKSVPFYSVKKSTLNLLREELQHSRKRSLYAIYSSLHCTDGDFGDHPRSKHQLANMIKKYRLPPRK